MKTKRRGISLIVLAITIIVMIIIATAIILKVNDDAILDNAEKAALDTNKANLEESATIIKINYNYKKRVNRITDSLADYMEAELLKQGYTEKEIGCVGIGSDNTIYIYDYPVIPAGFVASKATGETNVSEGLVIYEGTDPVTDLNVTTAKTTRNQYVWVPVPNISDFVRRDGYNNGSLQTYVSSGDATEPFSKGSLSESNDLTGEYAEYEKMVASVAKYGGFYIARYEAGSSTERTNTANGTTTLVPSQKDKYAYNYVAWGPSMTSASGDVTYNSNNQGKGAVELARSIYPESDNYGVVSTLCYGVEWDAIIKFLSDVQNTTVIPNVPYIQDSTNMGWYSNNYNSGNASYKTGIDVGANAANKVKNIYDMAGNMCEWTMEAYYATTRVARGGGYVYSASGRPVSNRGNTEPTYANTYYGFRLALYIK